MVNQIIQMEQSKHQKHSKLARPTLGNFARNEVAFLGASCEVIEDLMAEVANKLSAKCSIVTIDADHKNKLKGFIQSQEMRYSFENELPASDKADHYFNTNHADLALVNGNHYEASKQILILSKDKIASVERRKAQLTNILAVLVRDAKMDDYPFLDIPTQTPIFTFDAEGIENIVSLLHNNLIQKLPVLEALILAGGRSTRMGSDKSQLKYGEVTAIDRVIKLCQGLGLPVNVSIAANQSAELTSIQDIQYIEDQFIDLGPFGAICSAFMKKPNNAFLVLACDLPLIDKETIQKLMDQRNAASYATAIKGMGEEFPEPLVAIYEPKIYMRFLQFLSIGYSCPRKVLINSPVEIVQLTDNKSITNINTNEEYQQLIQSDHVHFR